MTEAVYTRRLFDAWDRRPTVKPKHRPPYDRAVAHQLYTSGVELATVLAAIRLALARLGSRSAALPPLPPPRSLAYILPVVEELRSADPDYVAHLLGCGPDFDAFR